MAKDNKTSKTARVMNLLSKKNEPAAPEAGEPAAAAAPVSPAAPAPAAPAAAVPPIVASMAPDASLSVQIKNALEDALEGELGAQPPAPLQPEPATVQPQPAPVQAQPAPVQPEPAPVQSQPVPVQAEPAPVQAQPAPVQAEPAPAQPQPAPVQAEPHFKEPLVPANPGYLNVMQILVEEKAPKYVRMFGLCQCERCMADVKAYTLNHLPSKYVVIEKGDLIPRLTVYEGKFTSDVTAQLLQACKVVMERPHHGR